MFGADLELTPRQVQKVRLRELVDEMIVGSVSWRDRPCRGAKCPCASGGLHRASLYLNWREGRKIKSLYVANGFETRAAMAAEAWTEFQALARKVALENRSRFAERMREAIAKRERKWGDPGDLTE